MRRGFLRNAEPLPLRGSEPDCLEGEPMRRARPRSVMLIRVDNHTFVGALCVHFRRSGFQAESVGGGLVEVARADAPTADQERREVDMHLRVWRVTEPDARAELI